MRRREIYQSLEVLPQAWIIVRVDGRGFSRLTETHFHKPFDATFHAHMVAAARALVEEFDAVMAYTQSDESSLVLDPSWELYNRRVEKIVSLTAATAAAVFSARFGEPVIFDGRCWVGTGHEDVAAYMRWRASDAARCSLHMVCYWMLRDEGMSATEATHALEGVSMADKHELLFARDLTYDTLPVWQRRGVALVWEEYLKEGFHPITQEAVLAERRRLIVDEAIPMKLAWQEYVCERLREYRDDG